VLLPEANTDDLGAFLEERTWVDFRPGLDDADAFQRLVKAIKGEAFDAPGFRLPDKPAPYVGLRAFETEDTAFFFGREDEISRLAEKMEASDFVAVVGASGSGKSSLVRAGLLARLKDDVIQGSSDWRVLTVMPGTEPLRALAIQLAKMIDFALPQQELDFVDQIVGRMEEHEDGLRSVLDTMFAAEQTRLLLFVDQFEELFTHSVRPGESDSQAVRFVANLANTMDSL
jgi:ATPase subunit of ABC transporter with duplicated ATPase domains